VGWASGSIRDRGRERQGIKVIADAKPTDAEMVRGYGADIGSSASPASQGDPPELPNASTRCSTRAVLGEESFGAIRDGGIYIPVRGWGAQARERESDQAGVGIRCPRTYRMAPNCSATWLQPAR